MADPYVDPASGVLRNRLGITDPRELEAVERDFTSATLSQLEVEPLPGDYDLAHLQAFHRAIFGDIYPWAGELRVVHLAKAASLFCRPEHIHSAGRDIFRALAEQQWLRGLDRGPFLDGATYYLGEINALHPFRDGNGRTQRAFVGQLSRDAGHPIDWSGLLAAENIKASQALMVGDVGPMRALLEELVSHRPASPGSPSAARSRAELRAEAKRADPALGRQAWLRRSRSSPPPDGPGRGPAGAGPEPDRSP